MVCLSQLTCYATTCATVQSRLNWCPSLPSSQTNSCFPAGMLLRNSNLFILFSPHLFHHWLLEQQPTWMHRKAQTQDQHSLWQWLSSLPKTELFLFSQWLQNSWQQRLWMSCFHLEPLHDLYLCLYSIIHSNSELLLTRDFPITAIVCVWGNSKAA